MMDPAESRPPGNPIGPGSGVGSPGFADVAWSWLDLAIVFAPLTLSKLLPWVLASLPDPFGPFPQWVANLLFSLSFVWMIADPGRKALRSGVRWQGRPGARTRWIEVAIGLGFVPIAIILTQITFLIGSALFGEAARPGLTQESSYRSGPANVIFFTIVAVTIGPIAEEFAFRGILFQLLKRRLPVVVAVVVQGIAFGLYHPFAAVNQVAIMAMGILLGLVYQWRKTLLTPILCHMFMNAFASVVMIIAAANAADGPALGVRGSTDLNQCRIREVVPGSAAEVAGLKIGDVITAVDGQPITQSRQLVEVIATRKVGDLVRIQLRREGESLEVEATLKRRGNQ